MKYKIFKFGLWAFSLIGYALLIVNLFMFAVLGLDSLGIAGLIMQAMMYNILSSEPLVYIAIGFIGGSIATYFLLKFQNYKSSMNVKSNTN